MPSGYETLELHGQVIALSRFRRSMLFVASVALLLGLLPSFAAAAPGDPADDAVRVLVQYRSRDPGRDNAHGLDGDFPSQARHGLWGKRWLAPARGLVSLAYENEESALRALAALQDDPDVLVAEMDVPRELYWEPVDETSYEEQREWVEQINLPAAWNITTGDEEVIVAVIDSGVSPTHPDLAGKLVNGYNAVDGSDNWADANGHGTHVAGIIAASGTNDLGTAGTAMDVKIMPIRATGERGKISIESIVAGINWAVDNGADVINLSLGATTPSEIEQEAVRYAYENGVPVIAAAGNQAARPSYPASYDESISVGALDTEGNRAQFSSVQSRVDISAPGVRIYSTHWSAIEGDGWSDVVNGSPVSGTSFSTAIISGVVALMRSVDGELWTEDIRGLLTSTAVDSGDPGLEAGVGAGQVDAEGAVRLTAFDAMHDTWYPADSPVASGEVQRTWLWGVPPPPHYAYEPYLEAQHGMRLVYYYDKSRMELTDPLGDPTSPWYVTNGLLVNELITGELQVGDDSFEQRSPAAVNVAGDPGDSGGPTYASFASVLDAAPVDEGFPITQTINRDGEVGEDALLVSYGVVGSYLEPTTGHRIADVFWNYLNSTGLVATDAGLVEQPLFDPWFFATGLPVTEAYWADVQVAGLVQDVLIQCFERRCLTYTPANPEGWRVEMGNVGLHYYTWRYETGDQPEEPEPPDEPEEPEEPVEPGVPEAGELTYAADFSGWPVFDTDTGSAGPVDTYYQIQSSAGTTTAVLAPTQTVIDGVASVNIIFPVDAGDAEACLVVRADAATEDGYYACIDQYGALDVSYTTGEDASETLLSTTWSAPADQIADGVELTLIVRGSEFWVMMEGTLAGEFSHDGPPDGGIGLAVTGPATFRFDTLTIHELS